MSEGPLRTAAEYREAYHETIGAVEALVSPLDDAQLHGPTGCPGWTVHDIVAHVSAVESMFLGRTPPQHQAPNAAHVRNNFGEFMENGVDYRRGWSKQRLLEEFHEVTAARLRAVDDITDAALERDAQGLFGTAKLRSVLAIRVFDLWSHEQDIRRATGHQGGFTGLSAQNARDRIMRGFAHRFAERGVVPDETSVVVEFGEPAGVHRAMRFADGAAQVVDDVPGAPTVTLRADCITWTVLACGRHDDPEARSRVEVEGDLELGRELLTDLAITP